MIIIDTERVPIFSWCNNIPTGTLEQAYALANLPFIFKQFDMMADTHVGYGMPIGGVAGFINVVSPYCVGKDIGCGMHAVRLHITDISHDQLEQIRDKIRTRIPVGFDWHKDKQLQAFIPDTREVKEVPDSVVMKHLEEYYYQIGTMGGGNHFIEIQKGSDGYIWFMIHSGSRNIGSKVADNYHAIAAKENHKWYSNIGKDLNFFPVESPYFKHYMAEMNWCLEFAKYNRELMAIKILNSFEDILGVGNCRVDAVHSIHHNYAVWENHFGKNVVVHRKGATSAKLGEIGIIPGSPGSKSYIVEGLGNPKSFMSCSHGAGRALGRKDAVRKLDLVAEQKIMEDQGIIHSLNSKSDLEEATSAYKDIQVVMEEQKDLVKILVELTPLADIKGPTDEPSYKKGKRIQ